MSVDPPETVLVTHRPIPGKEEVIRDLIQRHIVEIHPVKTGGS